MSEIKTKVVNQVELPQTRTFHSGNSSNVSKGYRFEDTDNDSSAQSTVDMMIYNNKPEKNIIPLRLYLYMSF